MNLGEAVIPPTSRFGESFQGGVRPTIGCDPELFAVDSQGGLIPAFKFLPPKDTPIGGLRYSNYCHGYWDGFQAEWKLGIRNTPTCLNALAWSNREAIAMLYSALKNYDSTAKFTIQNVVRLPSATLATALDKHVELGCDPSENAYGLKPTLVDNPRLLKYRFAGGHLHFGFDRTTRYYNDQLFVKTLDKILGVWAVGAAQSFDKLIRRKYYGLPGEFRTPKHGLEYRTLSNFWICHPIIHQLTWEIARRAFELATVHTLSDYWVAPEEMVQECIMNGDVGLASKILGLNKNLLKWMFTLRGWGDKEIEKLISISEHGIESAVKDPDDLYENWKIQHIGEYISPAPMGPGPYSFAELPASSTDDPYWTFFGFARGTEEKI